jgi:glycogen debranching enzyme
MNAVRIFSLSILAYSINFLYIFYLQSIQDNKLANVVTLLNGLIFPVAFDYSPLEPEQKKSVLDFCTRELLTPKGLRTLSPKSGGYNPMYVGPQTRRDYAYHSGTAWPWLGGFYMEAYLKLYKRSRLSFVQRQMVGYEDEMQYHVLGSISELFDGNPPFNGRGASSFAMNVAEILRTWRLIDQFN